jgi:lipid-A-disaccharide synthase
VADFAGLDVMGFAEVLANIALFKAHVQTLLTAIDRRRPAVAILVDYPGLHFYLAEQLHLRQIPVVQYVAPKVWAWGKSRVGKLRRDFSLVLGMLPFEEEFFRRQQVPYAYIGSPLRDRSDEVSARLPAQSLAARTGLGCSEFSPLLGFLPGSRKEEISNILPLLPQLNSALKKYFPRLGWVIPLAENIGAPDESSWLTRALQGIESANITVIRGNSLEIMRMADACVVASGTATLECALLATPLVAVYRMNELNYQLARRVVKLPWVSLVNLVLNRSAIVEFLQNFSLDAIVTELRELIEGQERRQRFFADVEALHACLGPHAAAQAADKILPLLPPLF